MVQCNVLEKNYHKNDFKNILKKDIQMWWRESNKIYHDKIWQLQVMLILANHQRIYELRYNKVIEYSLGFLSK